MQISFGKKIPIARCQIQNKHTEKFETATVFEYDCKDKSDLEIANQPAKDWKYAHILYAHMEQKNIDSSDKKFFYFLEQEEGKPLGMCEINETDDDMYVLRYIDTKKGKQHKFVGQTILATAAKEIVRKEGKELMVVEPVSSAIPFYENVCNFPRDKYNHLCMTQEEMQAFVKRTEERTHSPLVDIKG